MKVKILFYWHKAIKLIFLFESCVGLRQAYLKTLDLLGILNKRFLIFLFSYFTTYLMTDKMSPYEIKSHHRNKQHLAVASNELPFAIGII